MWIDASLAHGLAQRSHRELQEQDHRLAEFGKRKQRARSTGPKTHKGARRYLRELLAPLKARAVYVMETETRRDGPVCRYLDFRACREHRQIVLVRGCCAPLSPVIEGGETALAFFSRHALARGHQRCAEVEWAKLKPHVAVAAETLWLMNSVAAALGLKQGFLATADGLFVGSYQPDGVLQLETFIRLEQPHGRWPQIHALLKGLHSRFAPTREALLAALSSNDGQTLTAARDWLGEKLARPRYDWLREPHAARPDPIGELWELARAAAAQDEHPACLAA